MKKENKGNTFCRKIKTQEPEGEDNEPRKERGLDKSHQKNELQGNRNWELKVKETQNHPEVFKDNP
jgi:hypothetical protein